MKKIIFLKGASYAGKTSLVLNIIEKCKKIEYIKKEDVILTRLYDFNCVVIGKYSKERKARIQGSDEIKSLKKQFEIIESLLLEDSFNTLIYDSHLASTNGQRAHKFFKSLKDIILISVIYNIPFKAILKRIKKHNEKDLRFEKEFFQGWMRNNSSDYLFRDPESSLNISEKTEIEDISKILIKIIKN